MANRDQRSFFLFRDNASFMKIKINKPFRFAKSEGFKAYNKVFQQDLINLCNPGIIIVLQRV